MSTVLYLANQQIRVVVGKPGQNKISVTDTYFGEAPEGSIINGMVMDQESFISFMKDFWFQNHLERKDVTIVINSTKFLGKNIEIPVMNEKKTLEFVDREFSELRRDETFIYGYKNIGMNGKLRKLYVDGIYPDFIKEYVDIFAQIGVKIKAIYSGESSLIRLTEMTIGKTYKTFVLQIAEKMTITTLLWVDGTFYYFNSARCFHEQGTEDYAFDIARSVSNVRQFMQAHQIDFPLEAVVLAGIEPYKLSMYQSAIIQQGIQTSIVLFDASSICAPNIDIQYHLHATSGLVIEGNGKSQNLLLRYWQSVSRSATKKGIGKYPILILSTLAVMLMLLAVSLTARNMKRKSLNEIKEYNEDPVIQMQVARYNVLIEQNTYLQSQYNAINDIEDNIYTYPVCNDNVTKVIDKCAALYAEVTYESFDADIGVISMVVKSDTVDNINLFIKSLCMEDIFSNVDYTGYSFIENENMWDIHVICTLAESAGR
ncbi:MAG: hypothetical protein Q4D54_04975 [Eubacteriales bacterium]|nr:hypothetical protein [Eubacteriales bacterium]